jgi:hypothetical protein
VCGLGLVLGFGLLVPGGAGAEGAGAKDEPPAPVALDALFKLPSQTPRLEAPERGGETQREWLERFDVARDDLARARARLEATQTELEQLASSSQNWQVAAPGGQPGGENGPLSFRLRQQIRRDREEVEKAEHNLNELRVEAELASVPPEWTGEPVDPPVEDAQP